MRARRRPHEAPPLRPTRMRVGRRCYAGGAMTLGSLIALIVVAGICGSIGRAIAGYSHLGCLGSIALGFIGALLGSWVARSLHLPELLTVRLGGESFPVLW